MKVIRISYINQIGMTTRLKAISPTKEELRNKLEKLKKADGFAIEKVVEFTINKELKDPNQLYELWR